jgi:hypothetical protein
MKNVERQALRIANNAGAEVRIRGWSCNQARGDGTNSAKRFRCVL